MVDVSIHKIALAKISINILLFLPGVLLSIFVLYSVFNVDIYYLIAVVALLVATLFFISITGFLVNLRFPTYTWSNDMEVVKQSKATIIIGSNF